ncbi:MAG: DnaA/Hda family protein [Alphaproteobacteria bacterium]|nr:DnaA/Hda family protein [Alphaproteobacteria bacterium]
MVASQFNLSLPTATAYSLEDFAVSGSNAQLFHHIIQWPQWPQSILVLQGAEASGKTHLANIWAMQSNATFLKPACVSGDMVQDIVQRKVANGAYVIDGLSQVADETALFHLMNAIREQQGWLLLTTTEAPAHLAIGLADLRSRLCAAPLFALAPPDDEALTMVIVKQFTDRQIRVGEEVVQYLLKRMQRSYASARQWVKRLDEAALTSKSNISVKLVRQLMEEDERKNTPPMF